MSNLAVKKMTHIKFHKYLYNSIVAIYLKKSLEIDLSLIVSNLEYKIRNSSTYNSSEDNNIKMVITDKYSNLIKLKQNILNNLDNLVETGDLVKSRFNLCAKVSKELGTYNLNLPIMEVFPNNTIHLSGKTIAKSLEIKRSTVLGCMHNNDAFRVTNPIDVGSLKHKLNVFHMV